MGTQAHLDFNTWDIPTAAFLDIQDGDDNTAALGDGNKPFRTVNAALSASDFIIIKPCIVFQTILLSSPQDNNKHIHCMDGVEFQNGGLFIVGTQVTRARFTGDAIFTGFFCELVRLVSTNCEVDFECKYADNVRTIVSMSGNPNSSPTLRFSADWLLCHCFNGAGYAVRTIGGADFTFSIK
jgi:hypothetical protein